jgi:hypothetical protein
MTAPKILDATADDAATINGWTDRSNGRYVRKGQPMSSRSTLTIGHRSVYRDPSF